MELVEGPTLADRIKEHPLPEFEALAIAQQIGAAIDEAHAKGIVHRDLKPANVKIRPDSMVKVLDFGLAKLSRDREGAEPDPANSPTVTMGATQAGVILGTAAYMSPEQARGKRADKRADIWAFGVVLWEMLTGEQLFQGETITDVLAAVVRHEPEWERVPAKVRRLLRRCLAKDLAKRLRDIGDAWELLEEPEPVPLPSGEGIRVVAPRRAVLAWAAAAVVMTVAAVGLAFVHFQEQPPKQQVVQYTLAAPEKAGSIQQFAISPDGQHLVMRVAGDAGPELWVRATDSLQAQLLPGTRNGDYPFWSPDSRYIGFFADGKLKKIAANGGPAQTLCAAEPGIRTV